jgi:calcium-dependent protein kinase
MQNYNEKCDIWSAGKFCKTLIHIHIGVMLYVMLVGFPPFFSENEKEIKQIILNRSYDFNGKELHSK